MAADRSIKRESLLVDLSTNITKVTDLPALLHSVIIKTALSAHEVSITDGASGAEKGSVPASAGVGNGYPMADVYCENGIYVDPDDSATGKIHVIYELWQPRSTR